MPRLPVEDLERQNRVVPFSLTQHSVQSRDFQKADWALVVEGFLFKPWSPGTIDGYIYIVHYCTQNRTERGDNNSFLYPSVDYCIINS